MISYELTKEEAELIEKYREEKYEKDKIDELIGKYLHLYQKIAPLVENLYDLTETNDKADRQIW